MTDKAWWGIWHSQRLMELFLFLKKAGKAIVSSCDISLLCLFMYPVVTSQEGSHSPCLSLSWGLHPRWTFSWPSSKRKNSRLKKVYPMSDENLNPSGKTSMKTAWRSSLSIPLIAHTLLCFTCLILLKSSLSSPSCCLFGLTPKLWRSLERLPQALLRQRHPFLPCS